MIIVSACLVGVNCKYSGSNNLSPAVVRFLNGQPFIPVCPEQMGGLPTPRPSCELVHDQVLDAEGIHHTAAFQRGVEEVVKLVKLTGANKAILKDGSPSCGCHQIYDGTFRGIKIAGQGMTAKCLKAIGVMVLADTDIEKDNMFNR